ncbi:MAG: hypothetical protein LC437_04760, partial [Thiohalomonas sp.]|nr:hypothetical protein [Thiohalomonas sp.]
MGCESNLRHWIILSFFSMKIKHFHRSWVYIRLVDFFDELKTTATQLNYNECWSLILVKAMEKFKVNLDSDNYVGLPAPS